MTAEFRTVPGGGLRTVAVIKDADGDAGLVTLYATPASNATTMFFRVEVK